ncbi:amino acid/polyamine/organocation transporter, APC superfamily [Thamnocephalis sphaerospora]|uniref:Amino acid/polyamine/organocation transporter, APC superfamily n=1 Tax=Thamnocephalis sphaerospora TaxID=78915 RepID=A0A4P9XVW9_9FUNG|nr:amino acid/polyamine/organocation transporter, APC superfamily [Thamnocephalis sphaerospora]|eukprot:RKP09560.1 amino acid/polyamine/organocation transporter, APC superfamily [Thamnocephalis sphaerospora]
MSFVDKLRHFGRQLITVKSMEDLQSQASKNQLSRTLGPFQLTAIGIGAIIGTGIFVLTGTAAAKFAGPAVVISFIIAGLAAGFAALAYAELASMIPIAGSAYTYTYATMGEFVAWIIGWDLILEYLVGAATVSVGWSLYFMKFLEHVSGAKLQGSLTSAPVIFNDKTQSFEVTGDYINLPAIIIVLAITALLVFGIQASARVNAGAVFIKVFVILLFIFACCGFVDSDNYTPFVPESQGGSKYGAMGVFTGATTVFFAYIGFDAVSTAAQEAKNPQRDLPIGIIASLLICTTLYIAVSVVLTGLVPYETLNTAAPLIDAIERSLNWKWLMIIIEIGAIAGLTSVMLILLMGQPRIFYAMASDGLFPKVIAKVHPRFRTPWITTIITGAVCAIAGGVLPIDVLGEMTSIGTLFAFVLVNIGVIILRVKKPNAERGFKVPGGYVTPTIGALLSAALIATATVASIERLFIWMAVGILIYFAYGYRHSYIRHPELRRAEHEGR